MNHSSIYVGKLHNATQTKDIEDHLYDIGLSSSTVLKINQLNKSNSKQASFCIDVSDEKTAQIIYSPRNWPAEVVLRPYFQNAAAELKQKTHRVNRQFNRNGRRQRYPFRRKLESLSQNYRDMNLNYPSWNRSFTRNSYDWDFNYEYDNNYPVSYDSEYCEYDNNYPVSYDSEYCDKSYYNYDSRRWF